MAFSNALISDATFNFHSHCQNSVVFSVRVSVKSIPKLLKISTLFQNKTAQKPFSLESPYKKGEGGVLPRQILTSCKPNSYVNKLTDESVKHSLIAIVSDL